MEINVLDNNFEKIAVVDSFTSLMWCKRYNEIGALDLQIGASAETLSIFKKHYYITRDDDDTIFRIEARELDTTEEGEDILIIGAVDCKTILNQRIIWNQVNWGAGTVENFIRFLITQNVIAPSTSGRRIINFEMQPAKGFTETIEQQVTYDQLGDKIVEICQAYGYGWKILFFNNKFHFDLYKGVDHSVDQNENIRLIFSPEYENLVSSKYSEDVSDFRNVALVAGEGEGVERKKRTVGNAAGLDRYELFVDASGISSNTEEGDLVDYYEALISEGKEKLSEHTATRSFEGEVDSNAYVYKEDYDVGDIVTVKNQYGITSNARITEVIETWDNEGYSVEPKFEYFEPLEWEPDVQGALLTESRAMMLSESATPLLTESAPVESAGVRISELTELSEVDDGCCLPVVHQAGTRKVTLGTIFEKIKNFCINKSSDVAQTMENTSTSSDTPLILKSNTADGSYIGFKNKNNIIGYIGFKSTGKPSAYWGGQDHDIPTIKSVEVEYGDVTVSSNNYIALTTNVPEGKTIIGYNTSYWSTNSGAYTLMPYYGNRAYLIANNGVTVKALKVKWFYLD